MAAVIQELSENELKALDAIVIIDHSGSMGEPSLRRQGKNRLQEVEEDAEALARLMEKFDDDGITAIAFSSGIRVYDGVKADAVTNIFKEFPARGSTNLAAALQAGVDKVKASKKQGVITVYTDGVPDDEKAATDVIEAAGKELGRPRIGFIFIQVGTDVGASNFLDRLDNHMKVDVVATVRADAAENLSVGQLFWLARNA
jgi:Mg-chelatase subunit ChlD